MRIILTIAFRNLWRHRGRSLVVGTILFLGALIMTTGNGVLSGMERGLEQNIVRTFMGHVVVASTDQESDNVLMSPMGKPVAPLAQYPEIRDVLDSLPEVDRFLPAGKNMAVVLNEEGGNVGYTFLLGVDWEQYRRMFPNNLLPVEGAAEPRSKSWALLPVKARQQSFDLMGVWYLPKGGAIVDSQLPEPVRARKSQIPTRDEIVLMGFNEDNTTSDIRLPIDGIVRFRALNTIWGHFAIIDIESYRRCLGYFASDDRITLDSSRQSLLTMEGGDLDALFGSEGGSDLPDVSPAPVAGGITGDSATQALLATQAAPEERAVDDGAWNLVFVQLHEGVSPKAGARLIGEALAKAKLPARAIPWSKAAGPIGGMALIIKGALFVFVLILFLVAAIIIMNTLSMAALERSSEIGMMRAIGATKGFVRAMFLGETAVLSAIFGGAGIVAGAILVAWLSSLRLHTDNDVLQMLYGGEVFHPFLTWIDFVLALVQLALVSIVSVVYPMGLAARITPLEAVARD